MKTNFKIICIATLVVAGMATLSAQQADKKVQIKIIENGKVITDTSFMVNESVNKEDLSKIPQLLNREERHFPGEHPGGRSFEYSFRSMDRPDFKGGNDSVFFNNRFILEGDSMAQMMARNFMNDPMPDFNGRQHPPMPMNGDHFNGPDFTSSACPCREQRMMKAHGKPQIHREIIIDQNGPMSEEFQNMEREENNIIIQQDGMGKKQIIINDRDGNLKTIHKKIDKDTEIIIIKKDPKKSQPRKDEIRK